MTREPDSNVTQNYLEQRILDSFRLITPPAPNDVFYDHEQEYFAEWSHPSWQDLPEDEAANYTYMKAKGRLYYLPAILLLLTRDTDLDVFDELLWDLTEPDFTASPVRYDTWDGILNLPQEQLETIALLIPILFQRVHENTSHIHPNLARRLISFWGPYMVRSSLN